MCEDLSKPLWQSMKSWFVHKKSNKLTYLLDPRWKAQTDIYIYIHTYQHILNYTVHIVTLEWIYIYICIMYTYLLQTRICEQANSGLPRESHSSSCLFCSLVSRLAADATCRANSQGQCLEPKYNELYTLWNNYMQNNCKNMQLGKLRGCKPYPT